VVDGFEVVEPDLVKVGDDGVDFVSAAECFDVAAQRGDVDVGLAFESRHRRLNHVQLLGERPLGHLAGRAQLGEVARRSLLVGESSTGRGHALGVAALPARSRVTCSHRLC
jgi:hypothetical protein